LLFELRKMYEYDMILYSFSRSRFGGYALPLKPVSVMSISLVGSEYDTHQT